MATNTKKETKKSTTKKANGAAKKAPAKKSSKPKAEEIKKTPIAQAIAEGKTTAKKANGKSTSKKATKKAEEPKAVEAPVVEEPKVEVTLEPVKAEKPAKTPKAKAEKKAKKAAEPQAPVKAGSHPKPIRHIVHTEIIQSNHPDWVSSEDMQAGLKFNKLYVLGLNPEKKAGKQWDCQCDCGRVVTIREPHLKSGTTRSCGCLRPNAGDPNEDDDIVLDMADGTTKSVRRDLIPAWNPGLDWRTFKARYTRAKNHNWFGKGKLVALEMAIKAQKYGQGSIFRKPTKQKDYLAGLDDAMRVAIDRKLAAGEKVGAIAKELNIRGEVLRSHARQLKQLAQAAS